jgi:hypothetical protein
MNAPTYSELSRAMGIQPDIHPAEISVLWEIARQSMSAIADVGTQYGDSALLAMGATSHPTKIYSFWHTTQLPQPMVFASVETGIAKLGLNAPSIMCRFAYIMDPISESAPKMGGEYDTLILKGPQADSDFAVFKPYLAPGALICVFNSTSFNGQTGAIQLVDDLAKTGHVKTVNTAHSLTVLKWN